MSRFGLRPIHLLLLVLVSPLLVGCLGGENGNKTEERLSPRAAGLPGEKRRNELGLVIGPPANLIAACKRVAQETPLTVYCPPIVPKGPVEAPKKRHENAYVYGGPRTYGLSLQSDSLIEAGAHDPLAAQHWVVGASAHADQMLLETVDNAARYPRGEFKAKPKRFTVGGIKATLVTGDRAGTGFAGSGHAIVYWEIDDAFYQASVHFHEKAPIAEAIARGLIVQMVECTPDRANVDSDICAWVFEGSR